MAGNFETVKDAMRTVHKKEKNKTLKWLMRSVSPAIARLMESTETRRDVQALIIQWASDSDTAELIASDVMYEKLTEDELRKEIQRLKNENAEK